MQRLRAGREYFVVAEQDQLVGANVPQRSLVTGLSIKRVDLGYFLVYPIN